VAATRRARNGVKPRNNRGTITNGELVEPVLRLWARRVPVEDTTKLAADIASLDERDGRLLALAADGSTRNEIAYHLFLPKKSVHRDLRRIFARLGGELP
jgi:DNA-binding NarL/FixJ family response regulator